MYVYGSLIEITLSVVKQLMTYNTSCILFNTSQTNQYCVILFTPITAAVYYIFIISVLYKVSVNTKTREHGSQSSRKLKMAPVR